MTQQKLITCCPNGKPHNAINDTFAGEIVCNLCGIVIEEKTTHDEMYSHTYTMDGSGSTFTGQTNKNVGESTFIRKSMKDFNGKSITPNNRRMLKQINIWDNRVKWQYNNGHLMFIVKQQCSLLKLNEVTTIEVHNLMKKVVDEKLTKGRVKLDLLSAIIYYICKKNDIPKSMAEISKAMDIPTKRIYKNLRVINEAYGIVTKIPNLDSYVSKYFSKTSINIKYEPEVRRLLRILQDSKFHEGKSPAVLVGAVMKYIVLNMDCDFNGTFSEISEACEISDVSLRSMSDRVTAILNFGVE